MRPLEKLRKVAVIGGESTGKSALCEALALQFKTAWVPEFARAYLVARGGVYTESDMLPMALGQLQSEQSAMAEAQEFLFCDTDLSVIRLWSETAFGYCDPEILKALAGSEYDAFMVMAPDLPWEPDPLREHPQPEIRQTFFNWYVSRAKESGKPWSIIHGTGEERTRRALEFLFGHFVCKPLP